MPLALGRRAPRAGRHPRHELLHADGRRAASSISPTAQGYPVAIAHGTLRPGHPASEFGRQARDRLARGRGRGPLPRVAGPPHARPAASSPAFTEWVARSASGRSSRPAARSRAAAGSSGRRRRGRRRRAAPTPGTVTITGTGFSECAVFGLPSGSSMWSALPWSAVIRQRAAGLACTARRPRRGSGRRSRPPRPPPGSRRCGRPCRRWRS